MDAEPPGVAVQDGAGFAHEGAPVTIEQVGIYGRVLKFEVTLVSNEPVGQGAQHGNEQGGANSWQVGCGHAVSFIAVRLQRYAE